MNLDEILKHHSMEAAQITNEVMTALLTDRDHFPPYILFAFLAVMSLKNLEASIEHHFDIEDDDELQVLCAALVQRISEGITLRKDELQ